MSASILLASRRDQAGLLPIRCITALGGACNRRKLMAERAWIAIFAFAATKATA
jgi:hypothetical protein